MNRLIKISFILIVVVALSIGFVTGASGSAPPRLEVMIERTLRLTPTQTVTADSGKSFVVIYWEEPGNTQSQSRHSVYQVNVNTSETGISRTNLGRGARVTPGNAREYEKNYIGYYRYPASHTANNAQLNNYINYIIEVGSSAPYQQARIYPPIPNAHTNYQKNSDTCSGCHRTHYAEHPMLLSRKIMQEMCIECHDGSASSYDVIRGVARVPGGWVAAPAGPFVGTEDNPSTSFHNVFLEDAFDTPLNQQFLLYAPGSGGDRMNLTCTNCHSAHVTDTSSRYRLLKFPEGAPEVNAYSYVRGGEYRVLYVDGMNQFCGQCHAEYDYGSRNNPMGYTEHTMYEGIQKAGDYYRHPTGIDITNWIGTPKTTLPLEHRNNRQYMTCGTCHVAHGAALHNADQASPELAEDPRLAERDRYKYDADGNRIYDRLDDGTEVTYSSMLKRREGMGICLECHLDQVWGNTPGAQW
ncbi:cytochrome c3 family protein [Dethiobacter alkaliphilus]|uniref:Multiheme cytochrome n=1 Tax=Dethiobacter alkaliphilus AHT 1 TaxID=555088 RepID=C0GG19_DETAL|nr:cytochrome c3 family protein [Dethiobacter alkaliphilus]EEG77708.1 multiheme cytochrome [Dethiobacter alkaliphilus AHT 1]